jgi:hypothetical protein
MANDATASTGDDDKVFVTLRDVYDEVRQLRRETILWQVTHQDRDTAMFTSLNIKFYGILAGFLSGAAALVVTVLK